MNETNDSAQRTSIIDLFMETGPNIHIFKYVFATSADLLVICLHQANEKQPI